MKQFFKSHVILFSMIAVLIGCLIYRIRQMQRRIKRRMFTMEAADVQL